MSEDWGTFDERMRDWYEAGAEKIMKQLKFWAEHTEEEKPVPEQPKPATASEADLEGLL